MAILYVGCHADRPSDGKDFLQALGTVMALNTLERMLPGARGSAWPGGWGG